MPECDKQCERVPYEYASLLRQPTEHLGVHDCDSVLTLGSDECCEVWALTASDATFLVRETDTRLLTFLLPWLLGQ